MKTAEIKNKLDKLMNTAQNADEKKRADIFIDWINDKTVIFANEKNGIKVDPSKLPKIITKVFYCRANDKLRILIDKYYSLIDQNYKLNNFNVEEKDCEELYKRTILVKRNIIWVDFGCNIGCEFGGKHPAVVMKNLGDVLIVCPISTDKGKKRQDYTTIKLDVADVYNMDSQRKRFIDITRMAAVSILRIDTNSKAGSLRSAKFLEIISKIKDFYK